jgi:hypothetical protein
MEAIEVIRKLFTGKVSQVPGGAHPAGEREALHDARHPAPDLRRYRRPHPEPQDGEFCDGIITVGAADDKINMLMQKFEEGARRADKDPSTMPRMIQLHVSWAESQEEAEEQAVREWPNGGMPFPKADIRNPEDFAAMAKQVSIGNFKNRVLTSADLDKHLEHVQHYVDLGFDEVYLHNVGRNQEEFIKAYGERVIPKLAGPPETVYNPSSRCLYCPSRKGRRTRRDGFRRARVYRRRRGGVPCRQTCIEAWGGSCSPGRGQHRKQSSIVSRAERPRGSRARELPPVPERSRSFGQDAL